MYDAIIIGGGPAGMTAALYLLRAGKTACVIEKETYGGQIAKSPRLENFPSIASISGLEFSDHLMNQIMDLGAATEMDNIAKVEHDENGFKAIGEWGTYEGKTMVLACGCEHKTLHLPREEELVGKGISYCATCDGDFFAGEDVVVIGDANTALQYAIQLSAKCTKVTIVTLFDKFFADKILVDRIKENPKIEVFMEYSAIEYLGDKELKGVKFKHTKTGEERVFNCSGCFICIGQQPCNEPFEEFVELDRGFIVTDETMATKTPGVYACGDCRKKGMRQVITATSDAAIAAMSIVNYLNAK